MRLFTAITLPKWLKEELSKSSDEVNKLSNKGTFTTPDNYHITLVYLGEVDSKDVSTIKKIMKDTTNCFPPMHLSCLDIGYFLKKNQKILYYKVGGAIIHLTNLQLYLYKRFLDCNLCNKQTSYTPHITLARKVQIDKIPIINQNIFFPAHDITLMHSTRIDGTLTYVPIYSSSFNGTMTVDRVEEEIAVCELANGQKYNIAKSFLPKSVSSGSKISYNGFSFKLDNDKTNKETEDIRNKFNKEIRKRR